MCSTLELSDRFKALVCALLAMLVAEWQVRLRVADANQSRDRLTGQSSTPSLS